MTKQNQNHEVNIIDFFNYLINIVKKIGTKIINIFEKIFKTILWFFILLKKYFLLILIVVIISGVLGYLNKGIIPIYYNYDMIVEPNFNSSKTLYQLIDSYNKLASNKESKLKGLKNISIQPIKSLTEELNIFYTTIKNNDNIVKNDSIFSKNFELINKFRQYLVDTDYLKHSIHITSTNKLSSEEIKNEILSPFEYDPFFSRVKEAYLNSIDTKSKIYKNELKIIDTLLLSIAKGDKSKISASSLSINKDSKTNVEQDLLNKALKITQLLADTEVEKVQKSQVITLISEPQLVDNNSLITNRSTYSFILYGFLFSIFIILLIQFVKYLNKFEKKHS